VRRPSREHFLDERRPSAEIGRIPPRDRFTSGSRSVLKWCASTS